jgi:hypothetical protein
VTTPASTPYPIIPPYLAPMVEEAGCEPMGGSVMDESMGGSVMDESVGGSVMVESVGGSVTIGLWVDTGTYAIN